MLKIIRAENGKNLEQVQILWREYADFLKMCFPEHSDLPWFEEYHQNYEKEITYLLPGSYGPPKGSLLLAKYKAKTAGCVGLRDIGNSVCEMRRLFVRNQYRRSGIGRALAEAVIDKGRSIGYESMRLNTNRKMVEAIRLYRHLGFKEIAAYENFPIEGMIFMELKLV